MNSAATRESGLLVRAYPGFTVGVPVAHTRGATTWIVDGRSNGDLPIIAPGHYAVLATIVCGERVFRITRRFKVGVAEHLMIWV